MESYIYFARRWDYRMGSTHKNFSSLYRWRMEGNGYSEKEAKENVRFEGQIKVGETASFKTRERNLHYYDGGMDIQRYVKFDGTHDERLFVEAYIRCKYATNKNMEKDGNDHFYCRNINTIKGAENKFFQYCAEAFAMMEQIKGKKYSYECVVHKK